MAHLEVSPWEQPLVVLAFMITVLDKRSREETQAGFKLLPEALIGRVALLAN